MITKNNFKQLLTYLGFAEYKNIFTKKINGYELKVDFKTEKLIYPEDKGFVVNENQTCNFEKPENFVVFECVHRLLEKGYRAEHIELEKRWNIGGTNKGGRADICVYTENKEGILLIIECKTFGSEYNKAKKKLKENREQNQLFSYRQQDNTTQWISLYASDFDGNSITFKNEIISCIDDKNIIELAKKDEAIKLYIKAKSSETLFDVWTETYNQQLWEHLIFGEDTTAYKIGIKPLRKKDLKDFDPDDKIINQFEEILRHNNVSDKENAFNRLIALFICKLVDESKKQENDVVEFQYKQGTDTYETLQDRLQKLHKEGMDEFMKEKIFYISNSYADDLFQTLELGKREEAIKDLKDTIRILKFYSNNDFAFKDVHNEELFMQNGKVLIEMVQLFEKYRIVYSSKNQFLGDLFEQLLNKGFKQNEGQFFTPTPITRFIWDSLPVKNIIEQNGGEYPKVIDYACGSGHFLTEAVETINHFIKQEGNNDWVRDNIFGIEKDYRLARVSKVSMFMNGAGESNIIFGDGLDNHTPSIENDTFDILVANPPYSVSAFKSHLKLKNNSLVLLDKLSTQASEIEVLFCERTAQLLKPQGVAAIVLPDTILNRDSYYMLARELFLQEFYIRSIITFGNKTFGATVTNTVVLFLQKHNQPPKPSRLVQDSVNAIFNNEDLAKWNDKALYENYLQQIEVSQADYDKFRLEQYLWEDFDKVEYFAQYKKIFVEGTTYKNMVRKKAFTNKPQNEQNSLLQKALYDEIVAIEKEKIKFFALTYKQKTLVITAPSDNAKQKEFLGYDWSNRKGKEGIVINKAGGMLYNDTNRQAQNTLAHYVRKSFENIEFAIDDAFVDYAKIVRTVDMLDFSRTSFNKALRTSVQKKIEVNSKYPLKKLGELIFENQKSKIKVEMAKDNEKGRYPFFTSGENIYSYPDYLVEGKNIYLSTGGNAIVKYYDGKASYSTDTYSIKSCNENRALTYYLFCHLEGMKLDINTFYFKGQGLKHLQKKDLKEVKIPLPPLDIQQQIVAECEKIDKEYENSRMSIEAYRGKIAQIFHELQVLEKTERGGVKHFKISELCNVLGGLWTGKKSPLKLVKVIRNTNFTMTGQMKLDDVAEIEVEENSFNKRKLQKGDIIIEKSGGSETQAVGRVVLFNLDTDEDYAYSNFTARLRLINSEILPSYLHTFLNGFYQLGHTFQFQNGSSGLKNLDLNRYMEIFVPVPPLAKQQEIVSEIEGYEAEILKLENIIQQSAEKKKAVLNKYL